jgi:hypothetical protein
LVAFSCKGHGFRPSCGAAAWLTRPRITSAFADWAAFLAGSPNAAAAFADATVGRSALITFGSAGLDETPTQTITISTFASAAIAIPASVEDAFITLAFVNPVSAGASFDGVHLRAEASDHVLFDGNLGDAAAAAAFLDDRVLTFALPADLSSFSLSLTLDLVGDEASAAFLTNVAVGFSVIPRARYGAARGVRAPPDREANAARTGEGAALITARTGWSRRSLIARIARCLSSPSPPRRMSVVPCSGWRCDPLPKPGTAPPNAAHRLVSCRRLTDTALSCTKQR